MSAQNKGDTETSTSRNFPSLSRWGAVVLPVKAGASHTLVGLWSCLQSLFCTNGSAEEIEGQMNPGLHEENEKWREDEEGGVRTVTGLSWGSAVFKLSSLNFTIYKIIQSWLSLKFYGALSPPCRITLRTHWVQPWLWHTSWDIILAWTTTPQSAAVAAGWQWTEEAASWLPPQGEDRIHFFFLSFAKNVVFTQRCPRSQGHINTDNGDE